MKGHKATARFRPQTSLAWAACYILGCPHVVTGELDVAGNGGMMLTVAACEKHGKAAT